uniref:PD-(D/E)XK nuclease superfamily protein n=1 Tax=Candidatus Kentrum eta TaxID=2126337 RepID=A0A450V2M9_9GAMM|nr:MAG: hypothetical protein BECKH772A_GA0070896_101514 [Candidatus Kentron sp. H]VFJ99218.1 MAG: hypothetical protein BECKH772B_GA0070898_101534 [Candidatus Kentron sp. H]VFK03866.1 MAG: hypothetical protein BECKH772C_GA0070978_101484 [Candidatus Kentron sp. H]
MIDSAHCGELARWQTREYASNHGQTNIMTDLTEKEVLHSLRSHLPRLLRSDPSLSESILTVTREHFPTKVETEDRFTRMLDELAREREVQDRKWAEQKAEDRRKWDEQDRKWDEQDRKWEEQNRKWDEQKAEDKRKWEESNRRFDEVHREIMAQSKKLDRSIGALGARWGLQSEKAFRDALASILVESFGVEVVNVNEFDEEGTVFGQPDQIELDVIIKNGLLIICELKSSVDKPAMYTFERKVRFYERRHRRQANRMIVVSPMIEHRARRVGEKLGIEMYPDSLDVPVT